MAAAENTTAVPTAARAKETWTFDNESRWTQRVLYSWNGSAYAPQATNRFLWDGKLLLGMLDNNNSRIISFLRGLDLSRSLHRGGGAGGLLAINIVTNGVYFCSVDGNGNVTELIGSRDGARCGMYEFDPFGNPLRLTSTTSKANPIRLSTQFADEVVGTVKYLYRDYAPTFGRWLRRDPIGNAGGANYYLLVGNDPVGFVDYLGLRLIMNPVVEEPLAAIRARPGQGDWFADTIFTDPETIGEGEFERKREDCKYCVRIKKAKEIRVEVWTHVPNDAVGSVLTERGGSDVRAHEDSRRSVMEKGFNTYLAPVELEGALATKCGWLCCFAEGRAQQRLQEYMNNLRGAALFSYRAYVAAEQSAIDNENSHWRPDVFAGGYTLKDGYDPKFVHNPTDPAAFRGIPCLKCN